MPRKYLEVLSPARGPLGQPWDNFVNKCTYRPGANIIIKISFNVIAHPQKLIIRAESNEFLRYLYDVFLQYCHQYGFILRSNRTRTAPRIEGMKKSPVILRNPLISYDRGTVQTA